MNYGLRSTAVQFSDMGEEVEYPYVRTSVGRLKTRENRRKKCLKLCTHSDFFHFYSDLSVFVEGGCKSEAASEPIATESKLFYPSETNL